jgi:FkbM family methyltransferase
MINAVCSGIMIVVDVGASLGLFSAHVVNSSPNAHVFAIEPNSSMNEESLKNIAEVYPGRVTICKFALGEKDMISPLFGADLLEGQIASLKNFNPKKEWGNYIFKKINNIDLKEYKMVPVKSVENFIKTYDLTRINLLKIDAQGSDIEILKLFLQNSKIDCIVLEVNASSASTENIYLSGNNFDELIDVISEYSLKIIKLIPNSDLTEYNVFLANSIDRAHTIINQLDLKNSLAFGKYWKVAGVNQISQLKPKKKYYIVRQMIISFRHPRHSAKALIMRFKK